MKKWHQRLDLDELEEIHGKWFVFKLKVSLYFQFNFKVTKQGYTHVTLVALAFLAFSFFVPQFYLTRNIEYDQDPLGNYGGVKSHTGDKCPVLCRSYLRDEEMNKVSEKDNYSGKFLITYVCSNTPVFISYVIVDVDSSKVIHEKYNLLENDVDETGIDKLFDSLPSNNIEVRVKFSKKKISKFKFEKCDDVHRLPKVKK